MSAFLCDDCHLTALAAYYYQYKPALTLGTTQSVFDLLRAENLRSLEARYRKDRWWEEGTGESRLCGICQCTEFLPVEIVKAARCYEYQACEHDDWPASDAHRICQYIQEHALERVLAGQIARPARVVDLESLVTTTAYDRAAWGLQPRHG